MGRHVRSLLGVIALLVAFPFEGSPVAAPHGSAIPYCDQVCGPSEPCDTYCNGPTAEHPWDMTCGEFDGGAANGWCAGSCGDGVCAVESGENHDNCEDDCVSSLPYVERVRFPEGGPAWSSRSSNWPNEHHQDVDSCFGNCGAGCSERAVCNSRFQYWELEVISGVSQNTEEACFCADNNNLMECGDLTTYSAAGRWTYYGWYADGCELHDTTCRMPWWSSVGFTLLGLVLAPGNVWGNIWINIVFNPYSACKLSYSSFVLGGGCQNAHAMEWDYVTTLYTDEFAHDRYEYGPTGSCYEGPPTCGDGICQTNTCLLGDSEAGHAPGNGCEEDSGNCSTDCS